MHQQDFRGKKIIKRMVLLSIALAIVVIALGAYTRLTHAGLGCPDWPTCYGLIDVPETTEQINRAEKAFPQRPVEPQKAWNEMIHRYFAGSLGLLIVAIALLSVKHKRQKIPVGLPLFILAAVIFQAALGMWTVTMKLMPIVVMGHLLGGFTILSLLFLLYLRLCSEQKSTAIGQTKKYVYISFFGIFILTSQIALGGWTSANYAALSCVELPICQANWPAQLSFDNSFNLIPPKRDSYEFGHLTHNERLTIHVSHRVGAIVTSLYLAFLALLIYFKSSRKLVKSLTVTLMFILTLQVSLGISNIWFALPLAIAVAHNVVAACLMLNLITLSYYLRINLLAHSGHQSME